MLTRTKVLLQATALKQQVGMESQVDLGMLSLLADLRRIRILGATRFSRHLHPLPTFEHHRTCEEKFWLQR